MASKAAYKRLNKEYVTMQKEPPPFIWAIPDEKNILMWDYIIRGPPDSAYAGGEYHGQLIFPSEYPFKPPGIKMLTPSGRFQPDKKICFSMSDFHPGTWNPSWSVATILTGLLSFMLSDEMTTGSLNSSDDVKRAYAARSHEWNVTQSRFKEVFPEYSKQTIRDIPNMGQVERGNNTSIASPSPQSSLTITTANQTTTASIMTVLAPKAGDSFPTGAGHKPSATFSAAGSVVARVPGTSTGGDKTEEARNPTTGWAMSWGQLLWEKWRWGAVIALAVLVSRFSSST